MTIAGETQAIMVISEILVSEPKRAVLISEIPVIESKHADWPGFLLGDCVITPDRRRFMAEIDLMRITPGRPVILRISGPARAQA